MFDILPNVSSSHHSVLAVCEMKFCHFVNVTLSVTNCQYHCWTLARRGQRICEGTNLRNINQESTSFILKYWFRHIDTSPTLYRPDCYIFHFKSFEISVVILLKVSNNVSCLISSQRINSGASAAAAAGRCRADKLESGIIVWRGQAQAQSTSFYHNLELKTVVVYTVLADTSWFIFPLGGHVPLGPFSRIAYKGLDLQMY